MFKRLDIEDFRCIEKESLELKPLTILTGLNSTGKSTCFAAILAGMYGLSSVSKNAQVMLANKDFSFNTNRNRNINAADYKINILTEDGSFSLTVEREGAYGKSEGTEYDLEKNIFYLSANRLGYQEPAELYSPNYKVGIQGEYLFGTLNNEQSKPIDECMCRDKDTSLTLSYQISAWLSYVLGLDLDIKTESITPTQVKVSYVSDELSNILPSQLGVGVSYLAKILIMCLRAKKGDVLMIENPEIHLHPAAQARLGEFFSTVIKSGIQLLIETHSENLIQKLQYEVFKGSLDLDSVIIYYKKGATDPFFRMQIQSNGRLDPDFPEGFFDIPVNEILEMG